MELETTSNQADGGESSVSLPFPKTWWGRVLYGLFITFLPVLSFTAVESLKPAWQTGRLPDYVILFLFPEASLFFFPLLAYSIVCYLLLLFMPTRFAGSFVVRVGIYTGVVLALQYSILVLMYSLDSYIYVIILIWIFPFVYSIIYRWAIARWTARKVNRGLFILIPGVLLIATLITGGSAAFLVLVALTMAAPFWSLLLSLQAAIWLFKNHETTFTLPRRFGLTAWIVAYAAALRFDILKMYELYAALPPTPPADCYIATATARGHPKFVRAWTVQRADGKSMQVNKQLQRLKCAELAVMAVNPRLHKLLRKMYDVIGKCLARAIQSPFIADAAYLILKPWEGLVGVVLKFVVPEIDSFSSKLYTN